MRIKVAFTNNGFFEFEFTTEDLNKLCTSPTGDKLLTLLESLDKNTLKELLKK